MRRRLDGLAWCVASLLATAAASAGPAFQVHFGPQPEGLGIAKAFIAYLDGARQTLDLAFYEFRHQPVVQAVIDAHERGVEVRVVVDDNNYFYVDPVTLERDEGLRNPFVKQLEAAGIQVRPDDRTALMHNKFAVRDHAAVWTGSYNVTDTGALANANNAVSVESETLAGIYTREFEEMFVHGLFGPTSPSQPEQVAEVQGRTVEVYFGPEDDPNARLKQLIEGARDEVLFMQFAFTARDLSDALIARKQERPSLKVRGIFDRLLHRATGPYGEFAHLTDHGIPVVVDNRPEGKLHHKVFVFDVDGDDPVVALGSANASANANQANDENLMVVHDRDLARAYRDEFEKHYRELARARAVFMVRGLPLADREIPDADLVITSGGRAIRGVRIERPARWPKDDPPQILVHRHGENVTTEVGLTVSPDGRWIQIPEPGIHAYGRDAYLVVKFLGLRMPEIPGGYSMVVEVKGTDGTWRPLARHPTLRVLDAMSPEVMREALENLRHHVARVQAREVIVEHERELIRKHIAAAYRQISELVADELQRGGTALAEAVVRWVEDLDAEGHALVSAFVGGDRTIRRALVDARRAGVEGAAELARRLRAALEGPTD